MLPLDAAAPPAPLPPGGFSVVMADPPWQYAQYSDAKNGAASSAMHTMPVEDIAALPVASWAARDALLFLWATLPKLPEALHVVDAWGFTYITAVPWVKYTASTGQLRSIVGFWTRGTSELCIIARRGKAKRCGSSRDTPAGMLTGDASDAGARVFYAPPGGIHSAKPLEFRAWVERVGGDGPRVELFARHAYPGWAGWGLEASVLLDAAGAWLVEPDHTFSAEKRDDTGDRASERDGDA